ncbi:spore protease gpr related [hydrocarbon metagenome]|uniref:Spore protease gpr related n=1 Tax=hydrocarbon metagenome TaxID=938273 RepID=A0A0W8E3F4_9ZZZZ
MNSSLLAAAHFDQPDARSLLASAFMDIFNAEQQPVFICIGSDRHLLDCLGPLTGTMLQEQSSSVLVFGTLQEPWHAGNLSLKLRELRSLYPYRPAVAIDASIGDSEPPGLIKLKTGPIRPGKAVQKNLPKVGDFAITGLVGNRENKAVANAAGIISLAHVYSMSRVISDAIISWEKQAR